ncbi:MAG: stage III sporulation protein AE [Clostridiales bacterium]|nr:stage III sporulation protein AE [Clostridiales bacterium]
MRKILIFAAVLWLFSSPVLGSDLNGKLSGFNYAAAEEEFYEGTGIKINFADLVYGAVSGDGFWDKAADLFIDRVLGEGLASLKGIRLLIIMGILSGFFKNLTDSFSKKGTAETGFWVCYMVCVGLGLGAFLPMVKLMSSFCSEVSGFVQSCLPLMLTVITAGGSPTEALSYGGIVSLSVGVTAKLAETLTAPLLRLAAVICVVNCISEEKSLDKLFLLIKKLTETALKTGAVLFGLVCSLSRIGSGAGGGLIKKGAKAAVEMVPVAGDVIKGSLDAGAAVLGAVKSGTGIVFIVLIGVYAALPVLKVLAAGLAFKLAAGLMEPVCDKRIAEMADSLGDLTFLILGVIFLVAYVFIFGALVFIAVTNG